MTFRRIKQHKCAVKKALRPIDVSAEAAAAVGKTCARCSDRHVGGAANFRQWRDQQLCGDCYQGDPNIKSHVESMYTKLLHRDIANGEIDCALCSRALIDAERVRKVRQFDRDHVDVGRKRAAVSHLMTAGAPEEEVMAEAAKCRNLCKRCHEAVTYAERRCGLYTLLKVLPSDSDLIATCYQRIEKLAKAIIFSHRCI